MIEIDGVTVVYGSTVALHSVSLQLTPGITGLFGPNAAGKSTLLRVVAGLLRPREGKVTWRGHRLQALGEAGRRMVGWSGHHAGLYGSLTITENLELFARLYDATSDHVKEAIEALGLQGKRDVRVEDLSAGFLRRASVARALLHSPVLLLLDEPYANLDDDAAALMSGAITRWRDKTRGQGVCLVATHGAKRVKPFADASVILQHGNVISHRVRSEGGR